MTAIIKAITKLTDREWPQDHPLRQGAAVLTDDEIGRLDGYLVCGLQGEPRAPIGDGDAEVLTACRCGAAIIHRASAPKHLTPVCFACWGKILADADVVAP